MVSCLCSVYVALALSRVQLWTQTCAGPTTYSTPSVRVCVHHVYMTTTVHGYTPTCSLLHPTAPKRCAAKPSRSHGTLSEVELLSDAESNLGVFRSMFMGLSLHHTSQGGHKCGHQFVLASQRSQFSHCFPIEMPQKARNRPLIAHRQGHPQGAF